jgi:hypothetical protein
MLPKRFSLRSLGVVGSGPRTQWSALEVTMPAIASLEDLKAAQKDLLEAKDLDDLKKVFKRWRRIGWKNVCKLWLEERTPEQLKGESE